MTVHKHTPGPWLIADSGNFVYALNAAGSNRFWLSVSAAGPDHADDAEVQANALLIAAAPELLSEIQNMLALVRLKYGNLDPDANTLMERAEAAIAKATGGTP